MRYSPSIEIDLNQIAKGLKLCIDDRNSQALYDAGEGAKDHNEARYQLAEGCSYEYEFNQADYRLGDIGENIVQPRKRTPHLGLIAPNIFVGTLSIPVFKDDSDEALGYVELEVQSIKSGYRDDYRDMLELITEKCTDLLLRSNSPVSQHFDIDYSKPNQTHYQKFAFIKSIIGTDDFADAVHRIVTSPVTKWTEVAESRDIRSARRFSNKNIKEILKGCNRTKLPEMHYLRKYGIDSLPDKITSIRKTDSLDTHENRFIKHALDTFLKFCTDMNSAAIKFGYQQMKSESDTLIRILEGQLHHTVFKEISRPTTLKLNSPVLQRKEGYREILRVWLMFDLAAKLIWKGGEDVYNGGKKDIATLYEYWLFFKLLDLFQEIFSIESKDVSDLIQETQDGLSLQIKQGKHTALRGVYDSGTRKLNVRFNYNRSFSGKKIYPDAGSWTTTLRPDYTLSFWPFGISEPQAEEEELIVHVHFDAKYKVANFGDFLRQDADEDLNDEKTDNRKGIYKNADLLKMHAYKDAIRRTGGAYVLYPGGTPITRKGFHEIVPGLGAFPVKPSKQSSGINELKTFILEIIEHFINRASQREKQAFRTYDVHRSPPEEGTQVNEFLPEPYGKNRALIPDETFVIIGFYNSIQHREWILKEGLYNFRAGSRRGSLVLDKQVVSAQYLLLHTSGDKNSGDLWKVKSAGPRVFSKSDMQKRNYPPGATEIKEYYLVIEVEPANEVEFKYLHWDFRELAKYKGKRGSGIPFTASLGELMKHKILCEGAD